MSCTNSGSKRDASSVYSTSSQNSVVIWRRSKIGGWAAEDAGAGFVAGLDRTAFLDGQPRYRVEQASAVTDGTDTEFRQIRAGQMRQHGRVDVIVDKRPEVGPETELMEPRADEFGVRTGNWPGHLKIELGANSKRVSIGSIAPKRPAIKQYARTLFQNRVRRHVGTHDPTMPRHAVPELL